ncbi:GPI-anchor transamidase [Achlya hypogyna]|uniref:GPI-anchor transamidase n=1 Tax=Achlya hypogyna TaxID=1202772 RepID=A0A0A7CMT5_ACHHY|nr:secreted protein [Achlya hypogyna]OQR94354.1 GPI-anchor transamidase [Achlya hypogyna]
MTGGTIRLGCLLLLLTAALGYERHTNNWAVIVDASRFWFNYRHITNALSLYHSVKRLGIPDSQIVLMLADQMPCNARNCYPGQMFNSNNHAINLYGEDVEVDYRGDEVSVANFIKVLTGRHEPGTPANRRLDSDEKSNVFVFMTGHGGDGFLKFQDFEELSSHDIADSIQEMHVKGRYHELFFMVDTCQAGSLAKQLYSPNVVTIGSASTGQNSYAYHTDYDIGLSLIDRFTYATLDYLQGHDTGREASLQDLFASYDPAMLYSTPEARTELFQRPLSRVPVTDFLGSVLHVQPHDEAYPVVGPAHRPAAVEKLYELAKGVLPSETRAPEASTLAFDSLLCAATLASIVMSAVVASAIV